MRDERWIESECESDKTSITTMNTGCGPLVVWVGLLPSLQCPGEGETTPR